MTSNNCFRIHFRYHCHYCQYQSYIRGKVTRHIQQVHSGLPIKIDHRPIAGIKEKIQSLKLRCFPFLACEGNDAQSGAGAAAGGGAGAGGQANKSLPEVDQIMCRICQATVLALEASMDEHLQIHISTKYYHCPVCTYQTTYLIRAKQHVHSAHPTNQETRILCCPPDGLKALQLLRIKCFGADVWTGSHKQLSFEAAEQRPVADQLLIDDDLLMDDAGDLDVPIPVSTGEEDDEDLVEFGDGCAHEAVGSSGASASVGRIGCALCKALVSNQPTTISSHVRNHLSDFKP